MIETLTLLAITGLFSWVTRDTTKPDPAQTPGLSSQRSQIQQVSPSKQPYLGPKRHRSAEFYRQRRVKKAIRKLPF